MNDRIDWTEVHLDYALRPYGDQICINADGSHFIIDSSLSLRENGDVIAILKCQGNNIDRTTYYEGWAEPQDDGTYLTDDGRELTYEEMITESIREGEWNDLYDDWEQELT